MEAAAATSAKRDRWPEGLEGALRLVSYTGYLSVLLQMQVRYTSSVGYRVTHMDMELTGAL